MAADIAPRKKYLMPASCATGLGREIEVPDDGRAGRVGTRVVRVEGEYLVFRRYGDEKVARAYRETVARDSDAAQVQELTDDLSTSGWERPNDLALEPGAGHGRLGEGGLELVPTRAVAVVVLRDRRRNH